MPAALYRLWQFGRLLAGPFRLTSSMMAEVRSWLPPSLYALYCRMAPAERYHAYRVRQTLAARGRLQPDLLTAALLHDVGKTRMPLAAWERAAAVLAFKVAPRRAREWGRLAGGPPWWARPYVVAAQHPAWGAEMVRAAGGSPLAVRLIRQHQDEIGSGPEAELLRDLQAADGEN